MCLLEALVQDLSKDGYEVVASPKRRSKDTKPDAALGGSILSAYVTTWLERNRDLPAFYVHGSVDGRQVTTVAAPGGYVPMPARVSVTQT